MWETWQVSQKLRVTPSQLLHLKHPILAYYFDRAVWMFGSAVQTELDEVEAKSKNPKSVPSAKRMVLNKWIPAPIGAPVRGRYRDPAIGR
jgi:hypothetical protein